MNESVEASNVFPHLRNAPIIEAVLDWRANLPSSVDVSALPKIGESFGPDYVLADEQREFRFSIRQTPSEEQARAQPLGTRGFRFRSKGGREIVSVSLHGFSFSRLSPYTSWDEVFGEALRLWEIYRSACNPEEISRIAVRYINRMSFPLPINDLGEYLTEPPKIPRKIPASLTSLLFRAVLHNPRTEISTNVTQLIEGFPNDGQMPFILDIDSYLRKNLNPESGEIRTFFESLREMKNRVFFASLTENAINMFR